MIFPSKQTFLRQVKKGVIPPLYREFPFVSPFSLYESLASKHSFLFESVKGPDKIARYSFIGVDPCMTIRIKNGLIEMNSSVRKSFYSRKPLLLLKNLMSEYKQADHKALSPFQGGLAGMLSYDFVQYLETLPNKALDDMHLPDAHFFLIDKLIVIDHGNGKSLSFVCPAVRDIVVRGKSCDDIDWPMEYDKAESRLVQVCSDNGCSRNVPAPRIRSGRSLDICYEMKESEYKNMVKKAKEYIAAGDIFQANISQRVSAGIRNVDVRHLYRILRSVNPSPFAAFMDFGEYKIVSSSPERLLRIYNSLIETRPIAGTRQRGRDRWEDEMMRDELLLNEKERAEHIMLIDLERNDLGRVSDYGSVNVDEMMITEDCSHVIHIVSNVRGRLASGKDCFDAIRAAFPGGTITGVPKVRCMEIIDDLEPVRRGPYTGSLGYISFSGNMDLNIIIRTFVVKGERAFVQAGAGIVSDSDPAREYHETLKKAEALIKTLEML